jgi:hypothetical protein
MPRRNRGRNARNGGRNGGGGRHGGRNGGRNGARNGGNAARGGHDNGAEPDLGIADVRVVVVPDHPDLVNAGLGATAFMVPATAQRAKDRLDGLFLLDIDNLTSEAALAAAFDFTGIELGLELQMINSREMYALYPVGEFPSGFDWVMKVARFKQALTTKTGG